MTDHVVAWLRPVDEDGAMACATEINAFLQRELRRRHLGEVAAVEAARWLDSGGLLKDRGSRPGLPLRNMLRAGDIDGAIQRPAESYGRWFIERTDRLRDVRNAAPFVEVPRRSAPVRREDHEHEVHVRARRRRERAAQKYRPASVRLLLIAEAPPSALDRYFYFEMVATQDSLFRYVAQAILRVEPTRVNKPELLGRLRDRGVFLIDLWRDPIDARSDPPDVAGAMRRIHQLAPDRIIVIKTSVFDLVRGPLLDAGLPLVDERVPFPGSGQQRKFEQAFARALRSRPRAQ
jgi:hypothetical protein